LFSGQASSHDLLLSAGRAGHHFTMLHKPVHPRDLLARVSEILSSRGKQSVQLSTAINDDAVKESEPVRSTRVS
jgi:DNA-binding response OmpR family regulator